MNVEKIIKPIVAEILAQLNKRVLIFLSGGTVNENELLNALSEFQLINYQIVMSDAAQKIVDKKLLESLNGNIVLSMNALNKALKNTEIILIPVMSRNSLSKVALGISDNMFTTGISRAIMSNKEIIVVRDSYDPQNNINISKGLSNNNAYNSMILNHEKTLEGFGIKFIDSGEFKQSIQGKFNDSTINKASEEQNCENTRKIDSSILTFHDINQFCEDGKIIIKRGTIITPLAKDYIYNNNIRIEFY